MAGWESFFNDRMAGRRDLSLFWAKDGGLSLFWAKDGGILGYMPSLYTHGYTPPGIYASLHSSGYTTAGYTPLLLWCTPRTVGVEEALGSRKEGFPG